MNTPGSSFRCHSLNSRIARLATTKMSTSMLRNSGITKNSDEDSKKGLIKIEQYLLKKRTISDIKQSMVVSATLIGRDDDGIHVRIHNVYHLHTSTTSCTEKKFESIDAALDIRAICLFDEIETNLDKKLYCKQFKIGSQVKGVIIKVDYHTLEIYITTLSSHSPHPYHILGLYKAVKTISSPKLRHTDASNSPYSQHRGHILSAPTSPFQLEPYTHHKDVLFTPSITRCQSSNSYLSTEYDHNNQINPCYLPSKIAQSPLYASFDTKENKYNQLNEFDLLQNVGNNISELNTNTSDVNGNREHKKLWVDRIRNHELFRNPAGVDMMRDAFGINEYSSMMFRKQNLCKNILAQCIQSERKEQTNDSNHVTGAMENMESIQFNKDYLRNEQAFVASRWALKSGVNHARNNRLDKAIKHYEVALEWDSDYSDAMVAKAAALTHQQKLIEAENCINEAIKLDPDTPNATKFLNIILQKKACNDNNK